MATVKQVLEQVDAMLPNQYTTAEKRRWLLQAEGFVVREVHQPHAGGEETEVPPEDTGEDTVLLVQPPFDSLYPHYLCAMTDAALGENDRYAGEQAQYNSILAELAAWLRRKNLPTRGCSWRW